MSLVHSTQFGAITNTPVLTMWIPQIFLSYFYTVSFNSMLYVSLCMLYDESIKFKGFLAAWIIISIVHFTVTSTNMIYKQTKHNTEHYAVVYNWPKMECGIFNKYIRLHFAWHNCYIYSCNCMCFGRSYSVLIDINIIWDDKKTLEWSGYFMQS